MSDCSGCSDPADGIEWRDASWCTACFQDEAIVRNASDDWIRRVLGTVVKPTFEPPLEATAVERDARRELLAEHTLLDETEARVRTLQERGLSEDEIASRIGTDVAAVREHDEQIETVLELATNTVDILE